MNNTKHRQYGDDSSNDHCFDATIGFEVSLSSHSSLGLAEGHRDHVA